MALDINNSLNGMEDVKDAKESKSCNKRIFSSFRSRWITKFYEETLWSQSIHTLFVSKLPVLDGIMVTLLMDVVMVMKIMMFAIVLQEMKQVPHYNNS